MINMLPFNLPAAAGPTVTNYGGSLNVEGFGAGKPQLAGSYLDKERIKEIKDMFGDKDLGSLLAFNVMQKEREASPERLKEQLNVLGPYLKDVARENQRLAMEANLFAGFMDLPNKASRAMAAQHYYMPETMQAITQTIGRTTPFVNRQYSVL